MRAVSLDALFTMDFEGMVKEPFAELPPELRSEQFFRVNELANLYVDACARDVVAEVGSGSAVAAERRDAWAWIERKLTSRRGSAPLPPNSAMRAAILDELPGLRAALDLIDQAAIGYPAFLRGDRTGSSILFDPGSPVLWETYFSNENPLYAAGNSLAAHAALLAVRDPSNPCSARAGLRVLEVGAGCGSAAEPLVARLDTAIQSYRLTDISPNFLRKARQRVEAILPRRAQLAIQILDLNREPESWRATRGEVDLIHAVNVLHAVRDLVASLRGLGDLLAPGGVLVLGECIRPSRGYPVHPEFVFQLFDEFRHVTLDPLARPEPGFLDEASWRAALKMAGFARVAIHPDFSKAVAAYPAHSLGAITAWRE